MNLDGSSKDGIAGYLKSLTIGTTKVDDTLNSFANGQEKPTIVAAYLGQVRPNGNSVLEMCIAIPMKNTVSGKKPSAALSTLIGTKQTSPIKFSAQIAAYALEDGKASPSITQTTLTGRLAVQEPLGTFWVRRPNPSFAMDPANLFDVFENGALTCRLEKFYVGFWTDSSIVLPVNYGGTANKTWPFDPPAK
jgi:hypothetical protein